MSKKNIKILIHIYTNKIGILIKRYKPKFRKETSVIVLSNGKKFFAPTIEFIKQAVKPPRL